MPFPWGTRILRQLKKGILFGLWVLIVLNLFMLSMFATCFTYQLLTHTWDLLMNTWFAEEWGTNPESCFQKGILMEDIRFKHAKAACRDPWLLVSRETEQSTERHLFADTGGIESYVSSEKTACHCGCVAPPAGFCSVCHKPICSRCFVHCAGPDCSRPLGPCCAIVAQDKENRERPFCRECYEDFRRRQLAGLFTRLILSPFIEFKS